MTKLRQTLGPRFWHGMTFGTWMKFLFRHRLAVGPRGWHVVAGVTPISLGNSLAALTQRAIYGRRIAAASVHPPIFIIGHWRTGTTLLHELLVQDERFTFPTSYECLAPKQSLVTAPFVTRYFKFLFPARRPMDNMAAGWDHPQEDEFALCNLGIGSPYERIAFPNDSLGDPFLDMEWRFAGGFGPLEGRPDAISANDHRSHANKPIVLKSPPHTARVGLLAEMFPGAKFVHIVRDPFTVFSSTMRLWPSLYDLQSLQRPRYDSLQEHVFRSFERMYRAFFEQKHHIPTENFCELRYEDSGARIRWAQNGDGLRPLATRRFRACPAEDRSLYASAEGLQDKPPSNLAGNAGRDFPPLVPVHAAIWLRLRTDCGAAPREAVDRCLIRAAGTKRH